MNSKRYRSQTGKTQVFRFHQGKNTVSQLQWPKLSKMGRITAISFVRQKETDETILIGKSVMKLAYKC